MWANYTTNGTVGIMRRNVWLPDELDEQLRTKYPGANLSEIVQRAAVELLKCRHEELSCTCCGTRVRADDVGRDASARMWSEAWRRLNLHIITGGSLVGFGRVLRQVGIDQGVGVAMSSIEPRPSRVRAARRALDRQAS